MNSIIAKKPEGLSDWVYGFIKNQILNLEIEPGAQIDIEYYVDLLKVSRTPIREAFLRLKNDGLVDVVSRVGYFVTEFTEQDIRDLYEVREIIESRAARRAAESLTDEELSELVQLIKDLKQYVENSDLKSYLDNEITFHDFLQKHMGNWRLTEILDGLNDLTYRERVLSMNSRENLAQTVIEHDRIVQALLKRNGEEAAWFMGEHLKNAGERLIEHLRLNNKLAEKG